MGMVSASWPNALPVNYRPPCSSSSSSSLLIPQRPLGSPKQTNPARPCTTIPPIIHRNNGSGGSCWRKNKMMNSTTSDVLRLMDNLGLPITPDIYASLVKECTFTKDPILASHLHSHIINRSSLKPGILLLNRLLLMHVSCGCLGSARQLFDEMTIKDFYSWAIMIVGYVDNASEEALTLFVEMQHQYSIFEFPAWIIVCALKLCICTMDMGLGKQLHGCLLKLGMTNDLSLSSSLINFYGKLKCLDGSNFVFHQMLHHNTVSWTAKIVSNCREEHFREVINDFEEMGKAGIKKNCFTFSSVLTACAGMKDDGQCGRQVHAEAIKLGVESNIYVQCGLVDMYGKCGILRDARKVFDMISDKRNIACWNSMVTNYIQHGFCIEAIKILYQMKAAGMQPQESVLNETRIACASCSLENGIELMESIHKSAPHTGAKCKLQMLMCGSRQWAPEMQTSLKDNSKKR